MIPKTAAAAFALVMACLIGCGGEGARQDGMPPVILISVDTLRADHLPSYGYRGVETPHIDGLRRDSVLFRNAYSQVPLTLASHASILTGLLPHEHGIRDNYGYRLADSVETLATLLHARGYATGGAISAEVLARSGGLARGFDFYDDAMANADPPERDGIVAARSLAGWIESVADRPFFGFIHLFEPHTPYQPPEPHRSRYPSAYDGEIARADEILGEFLARLKRRGAYDRSLLIFLSDHGEGLGDHGEEEHGIFLYREAIHVPLFVKLPGAAHRAETVSAPVALTDIFPTVARAADISGTAAGVPLTDHLSRRPDAGRRIFSETYYPRLRYGWSELTSLVDERYHYIEAPRPELYDLAADPGEKEDLARELSPAFRSMRLELARRKGTFEQPTESDPERAKKLASLGYITVASHAAAQPRLPDPKDQKPFLEFVDFQDLLSGRRDPELIAASRRFLARNPGALNHWRMLADALHRGGQTAEAVEALERGLKASAATASPAMRRLALERLVVLLVREGRRGEALEVAGSVNLEGAEALNAVGVAYAQAGRLPEAREALERALNALPGDELATLNLASVLMRSGEGEAARARLEEAVRRQPGSASTWKVLGNARSNLGDDRGAIEAWSRAIDLDPRQFDALYNLGVAAGKSGDVRGARQHLARFVRTAPASSFATELRQARRLLNETGGL
ncbi:MAG: sulfatase-like hydrolase/transferase [Thermoanaerobaculia bacterium]